MIFYGFLTLFGISSLLFLCEGQIIPPPGGNSLYALNGSTVRIEWSLDPGLPAANIKYRAWTFKNSRGGTDEFLGDISRTGVIDVSTTLYEVDIEKPATLILKNVNASYNGTYQFTLSSPGGSADEVVVFIAVKPTVTVDCSSVVTVSEGDDVTCVCKGKGGNPPADVTWFKEGKKIGETEKEEKTFILSNIDRKASGTYKCVAQSHTLTDQESIEIIVYYPVPPTVIRFTTTPRNVAVGESVVISCEAIAVPLPSYTIIHNNTEIVSTLKTYIITVLEYNHSGLYKCIAANKLGNRSKTFGLFLAEKRATNAPATRACETGTTDLNESKRSGTEWYIVIVSLISGVIIGILLCYIVLFSRRKLRIRNPEPNPEPASTVDTTYQELDLSKMNQEDNYQSLRVNAASNVAGNEDDSTYTELNKTRDVENNYQSLT